MIVVGWPRNDDNPYLTNQHSMCAKAKQQIDKLVWVIDHCPGLKIVPCSLEIGEKHIGSTSVGTPGPHSGSCT